jgi:hypothetical protein
MLGASDTTIEGQFGKLLTQSLRVWVIDGICRGQRHKQTKRVRDNK